MKKAVEFLGKRAINAGLPRAEFPPVYNHVFRNRAVENPVRFNNNANVEFAEGYGPNHYEELREFNLNQRFAREEADALTARAQNRPQVQEPVPGRGTNNQLQQQAFRNELREGLGQGQTRYVVRRQEIPDYDHLTIEHTNNLYSYQQNPIEARYKVVEWLEELPPFKEVSEQVVKGELKATVDAVAPKTEAELLGMKIGESAKEPTVVKTLGEAQIKGGKVTQKPYNVGINLGRPTVHTPVLQTVEQPVQEVTAKDTDGTLPVATKPVIKEMIVAENDHIEIIELVKDGPTELEVAKLEDANAKLPTVDPIKKDVVAKESQPTSLVQAEPLEDGPTGTVSQGMDGTVQVTKEAKELLDLQTQRNPGTDVMEVGHETKDLTVFQEESKNVVNFNEGIKDLATVQKGPTDLVTVQKSPSELTTVQKGPTDLTVVEENPNKLVVFEKGPTDLAVVKKSPDGIVPFEKGPTDLTVIKEEEKGVVLHKKAPSSLLVQKPTQTGLTVQPTTNTLPQTTGTPTFTGLMKNYRPPMNPVLFYGNMYANLGQTTPNFGIYGRYPSASNRAAIITEVGGPKDNGLTPTTDIAVRNPNTGHTSSDGRWGDQTWVAGRQGWEFAMRVPGKGKIAKIANEMAEKKKPNSMLSSALTNPFFMYGHGLYGTHPYMAVYTKLLQRQAYIATQRVQMSQRNTGYSLTEEELMRQSVAYFGMKAQMETQFNLSEDIANASKDMVSSLKDKKPPSAKEFVDEVGAQDPKDTIEFIMSKQLPVDPKVGVFIDKQSGALLEKQVMPAIWHFVRQQNYFLGEKDPLSTFRGIYKDDEAEKLAIRLSKQPDFKPSAKGVWSARAELLMTPTPYSYDYDIFLDLPMHNYLLNIENACLDSDFDLELCDVVVSDLYAAANKYGPILRRDYKSIHFLVNEYLEQNHSEVHEYLLNKKVLTGFGDYSQHMYDRLEYLLISYKNKA